jgi:hypothetical protein
VFRKVLPFENPVLWYHRFTSIRATPAAVKHLLRCTKPSGNGTLPMVDVHTDLSLCKQRDFVQILPRTSSSFVIPSTATCDLISCLETNNSCQLLKHNTSGLLCSRSSFIALGYMNTPGWSFLVAKVLAVSFRGKRHPFAETEM